MLIILISGKIMAQSLMPESIALRFLIDKNLNVGQLKTNTMFFNDSIYYYSYNSGTSSWDLSAKIEYDYNHFGQMLSSVFLNYNAGLGVFENNYKTTNIYTPALHIAMSISHVWESATSSWNNANRTIYETDINGNIVKQVGSSWNGIHGVWENNYMEEYELNSNGDYTKYYVSVWNDVIQVWEKVFKIEASFNYYDNISSYMVYMFDNVSQIWEPVTSADLFYDSSQFLIRRDQFSFDYSIPGWEPSGRTEYENNAAGFCTNETYYSWNNGLSAWEEVSLYETSYDIAGNPDTMITSYWNAGAWSLDVMSVYFYTNVTSIENPANVEVARLYPVPADDFLYLETSSADFINTKVEIFNVSGQLMASFSDIEPLMKIDVAAYPAGIYMVNVSNAEYIQVLKFVKK